MQSNDELSGEYIGDELALFAHAHHWKRYWSSKLKPLIKAPVLEVGAGIGSNLGLLREANQKWLALEPDASQAQMIRDNHNKQNADPSSGVSVKTGTLSDIDTLQTFNTILYIDVLEHIEQDQEELELAFSKLAPGGHLVILSPAHQSLFSPFDKAVGHYRRYNKQSLGKLKPNHPNAEITKLYYLDSVGCLASLANAYLLKSAMPTINQIKLWDSIMVPCSRLLDKLTFHSIGKTIIMVISKNSST